ncbi:uncharacterized protein SRS1_15520 [Sporisorium reilianum f. sp. reilianum]|uniref:Uncharacterized protein n=1 Tax=Sporisorium reilianum f. sp. reilianum TaxID=72559 RepID=A0A2N8UJP3_9BASI|nr:uncharacterized protein SRS1_15520 [Sporisorium reilianum f. sp. reilianum]
MSESLKSWLFSHCATQTTSALSHNCDLHDMPYLSGNRIQILRFLTFRPAQTPNTPSTDVWALVGDRTHCVTARFARTQVDRFHDTHALTFTSLKGALVTLTNVRVSVARVQVHGEAGGPYRAGQWALVLDVKGWDVVSSVREPVWFGGVKLVTSGNGVPAGEAEKYVGMVAWMKTWIRWRCLMRRAREEQRARRLRPDASTDPAAASAAGVGLPTPAQRNVLALASSQTPHTQPPPPAQEESFPPLSPTQPRATLVSPALHDARATALWTDFDLDAPVELDHVDVSAQWAIVPPAPPSPTTTQPEAVAPPQQPPILAQAAASQSQTQAQSDLDPYESGLSDYERESRLKRRRAKQPQEAVEETKGGVRSQEQAVGSAAPTQVEDAAEGAVQVCVDPQGKASSLGGGAKNAAPEPMDESETKLASAVASPVAPPAPPAPPAPSAPSVTPPTALPAAPPAPASSASTKSSTSSTHKQQRKRQRRQAALAALMAQIVD